MSLRQSFTRSRAPQLASLFAVPVALASLLVAAPASAAPTGPISGWQKGTEPSWVSMYEYVPAKLAPNPPILVLVHYCGGNASGVFGEAQGGGIVAAADKYGFLMVVPQTTRNCWDVATKGALTHGGGGDTGAIIDMVNYAVTKHSANANRVYVTGTSSGAMMAEGLAAVYPEVFKGSSEFAGVPAGCWSVGNETDGQWSGACAGGTVTHTAEEWGTMARNMYPGYTGARPRIQLWHGDADTTIKPANQTEAIKQWTNVLGVSTAPTSTMTVMISGKSYKREQWQDKCGSVVLDAWTQANGPHGTDANLNATYTIPFFGLDQAGDVDPQVAKCAGTGGSGSGGGGGAPSTGGGGASAGGSAAGGQANPSGGTGPASGGNASTAGAPSGTAGTGTTDPGTGGSGTGVSGSTNIAGSSAGTGTVTDVPGGDAPERPGCACDIARRSGAGDALAWFGALALGTVLGKRRRLKHSTEAR